MLTYCHTPIFDLRRHWHVSFDATFTRRQTPISLWFSTEIRQRGILKYLMFDSELGPLLSLFLLLLLFQNVKI